ncbi:MAG TPA: helix-turn-helix domain-containing protein [Actinomycetota bacterium]
MATVDPQVQWEASSPPGWEPVAEVCRAMFEERAQITEHINDRIRREIEDFEERSSVISRSDISWSTGGGVVNFIRGVAECRPADDDNLEFQRLVGRRSAMRGLPLQPLIAAYEVGFRELWSLLARRATGGPAAALLLEHGSIVWQRLVETTTAVAEGYKHEIARREAFESTATAHFLEALGQDPDADDVAVLAGKLGFDPAGDFQVVTLGGPISVSDVARSLAADIQARGALAVSTQRGRTAVVITQGMAPDVLDSVLEQVPPTTAVAVGGTGQRPSGALLSFVEAERALELAVARKNVCRFDDEWLLASLMTHRASVRRVLAPGIAIANVNPHLVHALRAFARSGFSVTESARMLAVSANSLRYRLTRWRTLTGWDPWIFDGLSRSLLAIDIAELAPGEALHRRDP